MNGTSKERLIRVLLASVSRLSLPANHRLGRLLGYFMLKIPNKQRRNALINIRLCLPELSEDDALRFRERTLAEYGKTYFEIAYLWLRPVEEVVGLIRGIVGRELVERRDGRGVIVLSPHLGAWELAGLYLSSLGPTTTFYKPQRFLDPMIQSARARRGATLAPTTGQGIRKLVQALRRGEYVGILPDQEPKGKTGAVFAPFFGVPAYTMLLVSRLARATNARVVFMFAERLSAGRGYRIHCVDGPKGIASGDDVEAATALNRGVEQCVRVCPEQYIWPYKRFRTRPEGLPRLYHGPL
ncbi:MAG: lysophospholipid acyltransferase family protein [Chromatiaceae bacterium]|jgi:Kdo2-lipid IVA lauroyltransferase/acyltransferase